MNRTIVCLASRWSMTSPKSNVDFGELLSQREKHCPSDFTASTLFSLPINSYIIPLFSNIYMICIMIKFFANNIISQPQDEYNLASMADLVHKLISRS